MEENKPATSGAETPTSGGDEQQNGQTASTSGEEQKSNPLFQKLKKEKDNYAKRVNQLTQELEGLKNKMFEEEQSKLSEDERYKSAYEAEKDRAESLAAKLKQHEEMLVEGKKKSAIKQHLMGLGLNASHESTAFRLMDSSMVFVDDETGAVIGAEEAAKAFHDQYKDLGMFGRPGVGVSHQAPNQKPKSSKSITEMSKEEIMAQLKSGNYR